MKQSALPAPEFAGDGIYQVFQLCFGRVPDRRVHENFLRRDMHDGPMPLDFNLWIVRNKHRTVLVDTGFGQRAAAERSRPLDFDPIDGLRQVGVDPDTIEDVILTHLHFDHAGNLDRFGKARFHAQEAEVSFATSRCMCESHLRFPYDVEDVVQFVRHTYAERARFHNGDADLFPGISAHLVPGHTTGIQAVRVMTPRGQVVLASDATHLYANAMRRSPYPVTVDAMATLRSYDRLMELADSYQHIIPGHDPKVRTLYPSREYGGLELTALHEVPKPHAMADLAHLERFEDESLLVR